MDKEKLREEILQKMKEENGRVSLPLSTWNKLAVYVDELEKEANK